MPHFSHQRSLAIELTTFYFENKSCINGLTVINHVTSCFSVNKFCRNAAKQLKSMILDFYDVGVL